MLDRHAPEPDPFHGLRFGKYILLRRLAVGGMAEVYLARLEAEAGFFKPVVIKQVLPDFAADSTFIEMFLDEARLAARLSHPNIAQTFDLGQTSNRYYLAMEFVAGEPLHHVLRRAAQRQKPFPLSCTLRVMVQLLEALEYAHTLTDAQGRPIGIVHRDVTPTNIVLTWDGAVKLLDFGIARAATQTHRTDTGVFKGKLGYMAPEQCRADPSVDHRADVFAAGAVLYALMVGRPAFDFRSTPAAMPEAFAAMIEARVPPPRSVNAEVPEELEQIILKAMARDPQDRFQSAAAMSEALERFAASRALVLSSRELRELMRSLFPDEAAQASLQGAVPAPADVAAPTRSERSAEPAPEETLATQQAPVPVKALMLRVLLGMAVGLCLVAGFAASRLWLRKGEADVPPPPAASMPVVAVSPVPEPAKVEPAAAAASPPAPVEKPREPARSPPRAAQPKRNGVLVLDAYPWAKARAGDRDLGLTPVNVELPEGSYSVTLENDRLKTKRKVNLVIKAGKTTTHFERFGAAANQ